MQNKCQLKALIENQDETKMKILGNFQKDYIQ